MGSESGREQEKDSHRRFRPEASSAPTTLGVLTAEGHRVACIYLPVLYFFIFRGKGGQLATNT